MVYQSWLAGLSAVGPLNESLEYKWFCESLGTRWTSARAPSLRHPIKSLASRAEPSSERDAEPARSRADMALHGRFRRVGILAG